MIGAWRCLSSNWWFLTRIVQDIQVSKSWVPPPILFPSTKQEDQGCSLPQFHTGNVFVGQAFQTWEGKIPPGTTGGGPKSQTALGTTQIRENILLSHFFIHARLQNPWQQEQRGSKPTHQDLQDYWFPVQPSNPNWDLSSALSRQTCKCSSGGGSISFSRREFLFCRVPGWASSTSTLSLIFQPYNCSTTFL